MSTTIKRFNVEPRYSDMAIHNGVAYIAGQITNDTSKDITGQTRDVLGMLDQLLAQAGTDKSRLLFVQIFLADIHDMAAMNTVWDEWIAQVPGAAPPRATVEAKLLAPEYRIEVVATAAC